MLAASFISPDTLLSPHTEHSSAPYPIPADLFPSASLIECPLAGLERPFLRRFSGVLRTYRHEHGTTLLRWVRGANWRLHSAHDCLGQVGFRMIESKSLLDPKGYHWTRSRALYKRQSVCIQVTVLDLKTQQSWGSEQEWFRSALIKLPSRSYLAVTNILDA